MFISESAFEAQYHPQQNHLAQRADGPFNGWQYETYDAELDHVLAVNAAAPGCVWTIVDNDGELQITSGYHLVNRQGYILTEVPFDGDVLDVLEDDDVRLKSDADLCQAFGVCCYQAKELPCPVPEGEGEKFEICTTVGELPEHPQPSPSFPTQAEAEAHAVALFGLKARYVLRQLDQRLPLPVAEVKAQLARGEIDDAITEAIEMAGGDYDEIEELADSGDAAGLLRLFEAAVAETLRGFGL